MIKEINIEMEFILLRQWKKNDYEPYAKLTSNMEVMRFFPSILTINESFLAIEKFKNLIDIRGWGFWAVELKSSNKFIGYAGLHSPKTQFPFSPCIEIGWRMENKYWENGYVLKIGIEILKHAFMVLDLKEVVYFSSLLNKEAIFVMKSLGMIDMDENFNHPSIHKGHKLEEQRLYKITKERWLLLNL